MLPAQGISDADVVAHPGMYPTAVFSPRAELNLAYTDDDLLFQSPDLLTDIQAANCITAIYLTSGDSGSGSAYAQSREAGVSICDETCQ